MILIHTHSLSISTHKVFAQYFCVLFSLDALYCFESGNHLNMGPINEYSVPKNAQDTRFIQFTVSSNNEKRKLKEEVLQKLT